MIAGQRLAKCGPTVWFDKSDNAPIVAFEFEVRARR
jgi:hypothetical protein